MIAPFFINVRTAIALPDIEANINGVYPSSDGALIFAPSSINSIMISFFPNIDAVERAFPHTGIF